MKKAVLLYLIISALSFIFCDSKSKLVEEVFSYRGIMDKEFRFNVGDIVPVTVEQSVEIDGDISLDGKYFYYSSNRDIGNYDIYLRLLSNITTLRITNHPSKDTSPSISPDGKRLAFVSTREDPEGDIYIVDLNPDKLIKSAEESITELPSLDKNARNITLFQDPVTKTVRIIKDSTPTWSPDGETLAFSSSREGEENIWLISRKGENLRKITTKGGMYPRFSPDGQEIIYISYRDSGNKGDIYTVNISSGAESRITDTGSIELMPAFMGNSSDIIYTLIDRDTDGDNEITLKDNSVLYYYNRSKKTGYPLTLYSQSSFSARWLPVLGTQSYKGIIIYSNLVDGNININLIPETGIIPMWANAALQYRNASKYITEHDDRDKYLLALERVYDFFGSRKDNESRIYTSKALSIAAYEYNRLGLKQRLKITIDNLKKLSDTGNLYAVSRYGYTLLKLKGESGERVIIENLKKARDEKKSSFLVPYLLEDLADEYMITNRNKKAAETYMELLTNHKKYKRVTSIHFKYAKIVFTKLKDPVSQSIEIVLNSGTPYQKKEIAKHLVKVIESEKDSPSRFHILETMLKKFSKSKDILGIIYYSMAGTYLKDKNYSRAVEYFKLALKQLNKSDVLFYRTNTSLGDLALINKETDEAEKYISTAVNRYKEVWREPDIRDRALWLINYYESSGQRAEDSGNYARAVGLYQKYHRLMTFLNIRKFKGLYGRYGPRSHILYIDAYTQQHGTGKIDNLLKEYVSDIKRKRQDFDKAYIYGLAYIYTLKAVHVENQASVSSLNIPGLSNIPGLKATGLKGLLLNFQNALEQVEWATFLDDTFIEPYLLKSWIYMYVDLKRNDNGGIDDEEISKFFPKYLWEKNIALLEKALESNNESDYSENEGNIHLNIANNYFLLSNFPRALDHYKQALRYKTSFGTKIEEALFYFHTGYCYWQNGDLPSAREEISRALNLYNSLASGGNIKPFRDQIFTLYKYFALFYRMEEKYDEAISWYKKTLSFASEHKIGIDRARYLQEIAYCYNKLGDADTAILNLKKAGELLKKYQPDEKKYKLRFKVLGLFSFSFYDLGQDAAVVGENKIFTQLKKRDKELLNISMLENISVDSGNYRKAIDYQREKIKLIKEKNNRIDQISLTTSLNNTGFYHYKLRQYTDALDYFNRAWKHASDEDVKDLQGSFKALMNLTNLYAFIIENSMETLKDPLNDITRLVENAGKYRNSYEKETYKVELEKLEAAAKEKKKKVEEKDKLELKERIAVEARSIYYTLDTAVAVLDFYRAEILSGKAVVVKDTTTNSAYSLYRESKNVYNLYTGSLKRFSDSIKTADTLNNKKLVVKLMQNVAACYSQLGDVDEAYTKYLDAIELAEKNRFHGILLNLYYRAGNFLTIHGKETEGDRYLSEALSYYQKGINLFERYPYMFSDSFNIVKNYYTRSIDILLKLDKWGQAYINSEKMYAAARYFMTAETSPVFSSRNDNNDYKKYINQARYLVKQLDKLSAMIESGAADDSEDIVKLNSEINQKETQLKNFISEIERQNRLLASYITVEYSGTPKSENSSIFRFYISGNILSAWNVMDGKVTYKKFNTDSKSWKDELARHIITGSKEKNLYIVLNSFSHNLLSESGFKSMMKKNFMYLPAAGRVKYYTGSDNNNISRIYFSGRGLKGSVNIPEIKIDESLPGKTDFTAYSALIDDRDNRFLEPAFFFGKSVQSSFILKNTGKINFDYTAFLAESALYSGISTVIVSENADNEALSSIISGAYKSGFDSINISSKNIADTVCIGYRGIAADKREGRRDELTKNDISLYRSYLLKRDFERSKIHLNRWISNTADVKTRKKYLDYSFQLNILTENFKGALGNLDELDKIPGNASDEVNASTLKRIYLYYYMGEITGASELISKSSSEPLKSYYDYHLLKAIEKLYTEGVQSSRSYFAGSIQNAGLKSVLEKERINLLYAEHLALFNSNLEGLVNEKITGIVLSDREIIKSVYLGYKLDDKINMDLRTAGILELSTKQTLPDDYINTIQNLVFSNGKYDSLSPLVLMVYLKNSVSVNDISPYVETLRSYNIENVISESLLPDSLLLLKSTVELYNNSADTASANSLISKYIQNLKKYNLDNLLKYALYDKSTMLSQLDNYRESYVYAQEASKLIKEDDGDTDLYNNLQLHLVDCESFLGNISGASEKANLLLKKKLSPGQEFIINMLQSRIELNRLVKLKQATAEDADKFDSMFKRSIKILEENPLLVSRIKRIKLVNEIIDSYINFKMKTGNHSDALVYGEVKKQINMMHMFKDINNIKLVKSIPLNSIMSTIPDDAMMIYMLHIGNDIFIWMLGKNYRKAEVIKDGYKRLVPIMEQYEKMISKFNNTISVSRKLNSLFKLIRNNSKGKKSLYIITDSSLEKIPFEIIGEREMLIDSYNIYYLTSPMAILSKSPHVAMKIHLNGKESKSIYKQLEYVALEESGINFSRSDYISKGIAHIHSTITYNRGSRSLYLGKNHYNKIIINPTYIYFPDMSQKELGYNNISLYNSFMGVRGIIINGASVHELNNAVLVDSMYLELMKSNNIIEAFEKARTSVRNKNEFKHPAFWAGIRLYLNKF